MDAASLVASLSPRCREVLDGILMGEPNKVIAFRLGISKRTVDIHRANLMKHLDAHNSLDVIRIGLQAKADEMRAQKAKVAASDASEADAEGLVWAGLAAVLRR
ncbi:MAG TPA: LuxR C-terminal-related transcriptional regulator [Rhizomicrobium sp.]|nr:LuxR C-terminal-related transcriptional regulator [Rhizomicrobium sp.]